MYRSAIGMLGLKATRTSIDRLFESFDPDGSNSIDYEELHEALESGGAIRIDPKLIAHMEPVYEPPGLAMDLGSQYPNLVITNP